MYRYTVRRVPRHPLAGRRHPIPRTISVEHQAALQDGRKAKTEARRRTRCDRVGTWRAWNKRDADRWLLYRRGELDADQWRAACRRDPEPDRPSDDDFKIVDGRKKESDDS